MTSVRSLMIRLLGSRQIQSLLEAAALFRLAKMISGSTSSNANGARGLNENLPEQTDDLISTPLFPFQPVGTKITVPFAQIFHFYCSRICS